jgi:hypothetical protein
MVAAHGDAATMTPACGSKLQFFPWICVCRCWWSFQPAPATFQVLLTPPPQILRVAKNETRVVPSQCWLSFHSGSLFLSMVHDLNHPYLLFQPFVFFSLPQCTFFKHHYLIILQWPWAVLHLHRNAILREGFRRVSTISFPVDVKS